MSEPKGYIANDPVAMDVWKRLTRLFAVWRVILIAPFTRRALFLFSNNQMNTLMRSGHWKIALGILGGLTDAQIEFLAEWARLNAERSDRLFRMSALTLVTLPAAAVFGLTEIDAEIWQKLGIQELPALLGSIGVWLVLCGIMMAASWRARDMSDLLELEKARRALKRAQAEPAGK